MKNLSIGASLVMLSLLVAVAYGWCINIYQLIMGCAEFTVTSNWAMLLLRAIGVLVAPLGGVLGLFF